MRKHSDDLTLGDVRESLRRAQFKVHFPVVAPPSPKPQGSSPAVSSAGSAASNPEAKAASWPASYAVSVQDLIDAGLVPSPLTLERSYKGVHLEATLGADGRVSFDGEAYDSLSTAAGMARRSVVGAPSDRPYPQTNGWTFWRCADGSGGSLRPVDDIRQSYLRQHPDDGEG